ARRRLPPPAQRQPGRAQPGSMGAAPSLPAPVGPGRDGRGRGPSGLAGPVVPARGLARALYPDGLARLSEGPSASGPEAIGPEAGALQVDGGGGRARQGVVALVGGVAEAA